MKRVLLIVLFVAFMIELAQAGPFGTEMGEDISKFRDLAPLSSQDSTIQNYITDWLPRKNSVFTSYSLSFWNDKLVKIMALGAQHERDAHGTQVKTEYDDLKAALIKKYGKPVRIIEKMLVDNTVLSKPEYFVYSIYEGKRLHGCRWEKDLPDNLACINLLIFSPNGRQASILLTYKYKNLEDAEKAAKEKGDEAL